MEPTAGALPPRGTAWILGLALALCALSLTKLPLIGPDEPRYARVAVEMSRAHEWVVPTLSGEPWLEKPPLFYWLAGSLFRVFGEAPWVARTPSVLAAVFTVGATALFGARLYGSAAGLHAGFILSTGLLFFAYAHAASMDMLLAAAATAAIGLIGLRLLGVSGPGALVAAYALSGVATLAKGPLGVVLPVLIVVAYALAKRGLEPVRRAFSLGGLAAFGLVAAPWYTAILASQGQTFVDVFLLNHNVQRFTSTVHNHPGHPLYYVAVLLAGALPWSGLILPALASIRPRERRADSFVLCWLLAPLLFFSLAGSKLPGYVLPCLPPLALMLGRAADEMTRQRLVPRLGLGGRAAGFVGLLLSTAAAAGLSATLRRSGDGSWIAALPVSVWLVVVAFSFSQQVGASAARALGLLRVGAAGLCVLVALAAPAILDRRESGRALFDKTGGRDVLAYGAWRTAWMAGYFYNDGRVREVGSLVDVLDAVTARGEALVACGPDECRDLRRNRDLKAVTLDEGPRGNALLRLSR